MQYEKFLTNYLTKVIIETRIIQVVPMKRFVEEFMTFIDFYFIKIANRTGEMVLDNKGDREEFSFQRDKQKPRKNVKKYNLVLNYRQNKIIYSLNSRWINRKHEI